MIILLELFRFKVFFFLLTAASEPGDDKYREDKLSFQLIRKLRKGNETISGEKKISRIYLVSFDVHFKRYKYLCEM